MKILLQISESIDRLSFILGKILFFALLLTVLISAGNAIMRKVFSISSNSFLEIQWYLFAAIFLMGAGYVFSINGHVRIDFISNKFSPRTRNIIDLVCIPLFLFPFCYMMIDLSWPVFMISLESGEMSSNAGGLIRWPVKLLIPVGFFLLLLQGVSEFIKRLLFLTGHIDDPLTSKQHVSEEHVHVEDNLTAAEENK